MTKYLLRLAAIFAVFGLLAAACGSDDGDADDASSEADSGAAETTDDGADDEGADDDGGEADEPADDEEAVELTQGQDLTIGYAFHAEPTRTFWAVVGRGAEAAAADYGGEVIVNGSRDPQEQAQLIEDYIARGVDGIVVSLANPDAMRDAIANATEAGIPVVSINSGAEESQSLGVIAHVGQTETIAGQGAGNRLNADTDAATALCVNHQDGNVGVQQRCDGFVDTFDGDVEVLNVSATNVEDLAGTEAAIQDRLTAADDIDAILTLNPDIAIAALAAIDSAGGDQTLATFDLSPEVLDAIDAGDIIFAIDQQQYLQGYMPYVLIHLQLTNANILGGGLPVLTGPGFTDQSNASAVKALAEQGTR